MSRMESNYDENLSENFFLQVLQHDYLKLFKNAVEKQWIICVPRQGSLRDDICINEIIISQHILISNNDEIGSSFKTLTGDKVTLKDSFLTLKNKETNHASRLLFQETFYTENLSKYIVWCIERSLTHDLLNQDVEDNVVMISTLADCVTMLWDNTKNPEAFQELDAHIMTFENVHKNLEKESLTVQTQLVGKLYQDCFQKLLSYGKIREKTANPHYLRTIKLAVESYVLYGLRNFLPAIVSINTSQKDAELNKIIKNLHELELKDLGIRFDISTAIGRGKMELSRLDTYMTVLGKVECLKRAVRYISESLESVSTDDLLPILIFIVVKAGLPNWIAQLTFIKQFRFLVDIANDADEVEFLIASLEAAVEYVRSGILKSNSLKISLIKSTLEDSQEKSINLKLDELFTAIEKGYLDEVEKIFNKKQQKSKLESKICHPLCRCENCERCFTEFQMTQSNWLSINSKDDRGRTALHIASICGHVVIVHFLLIHEANPSEPDVDGVTALHCAASRGHQNTVLLLLQADADPGLVDNRGNSPLHLAADNGHEDCVKAILYFYEQIGILLNTSCVNVIGDTPLHYASKWGYLAIVDILLEHGANPKIANRRGQTPLTVAHNSIIARKLEIQQANIVETVLKIPRLQTTIDSKSMNGRKNSTISINSDVTLKAEKLLAAIREGDIRLACYYLGLEGPYSKSNMDDAPSRCHPLCVCEKCAPPSEELLDDDNRPPSPIGINVSNANGETALHVASANGFGDFVEILLDAGANINARTNNENRTPLHVASLNSRIKVVKLLLNCCTIDINVKDYTGNTPLHLAAKNGDSHIVELLLRHGADVNCRSFKGATALDQVQENLSDNGFSPYIYSNVIKLLKGHVSNNKTSHLDVF